MLTKLFTAFVCPNTVTQYGDVFLFDQRKVEKIQRMSTCLLPALRDKHYEERLEKLQLPSLVRRHQRGDIILLYKIISNYISTPIPPLQGDISLNFSNITQN